jgi:hypothetical protein
VHRAKSLTQRKPTNCWHLDTKQLVVLTSDGGRNVRNAVKDHFRVPWLHCLAHGANLVIKQAFKVVAVQNMWVHARKVAQFFYRSTERSQVLTAFCKTRWNSAFEVLDCLFEYKVAIDTALTVFQRRNPLDTPRLLSSWEWLLIERLCPILEGFADSHRRPPKRKDPPSA